MKKRTDLRRLTHDQLTQFRRQAVAQVQSGLPVDHVANVLGASRAALFGWLARYRSGGWDALNANKRGGRKPRLDRMGMEWIYKTVTRNCPDQMQLPFALWTRQLVAQVIYEHLGVTLSRWSVGRLLRQLGLSPQRPLFRAYQQNPELVDAWKEKVFPELKKRAEKQGAAIYFLDESAVRSDHHSGTTWAPIGETPVVKTTGARFSLNIIGAISPRGDFRFMFFKGMMNECRRYLTPMVLFGCFRSFAGATCFCRCRSYISPCRKQGLSSSKALALLFDGKIPPFMMPAE